jgi:hypothetical protein
MPRVGLCVVRQKETGNSAEEKEVVGFDDFNNLRDGEYPRQKAAGCKDIVLAKTILSACKSKGLGSEGAFDTISPSLYRWNVALSGGCRPQEGFPQPSICTIVFQLRTGQRLASVANYDRERGFTR